MADYYPGWEGASDEMQTVQTLIGDITSTTKVYIFNARTEVEIKTISLVVDTTIALHDDNYYSIQIAKLTGTDNDLLATADTFNKTVAVTADEPHVITPDQNLVLSDGDQLELQLTKVASGANLSNLYVKVEYIVTGKTTTTSTSTTTTTTTSTSTSSTTTTTSSSTTTTSSSTTTTSSSTTTTTT